MILAEKYPERRSGPVFWKGLFRKFEDTGDSADHDMNGALKHKIINKYELNKNI